MKTLRFYQIIAAVGLLFLTLAAKAQDYRYDPPWNKPPESKVQFTVPGIDNVPDLFGDINDPQLVIFFAGNQFMCIDELIAAFKEKYPQYKRVFAETLPPGILSRQIVEGSLVVGNMRITLKPDVYTGGKSRMDKTLEWFSRTELYARNRLAIMVQKGNPKRIKGLADLGKAGLRLSMPDPETEEVGKRIEEAYVKAGGESLKTAIMQNKVHDKSTFLTQIHHRQSPMRILYNQSDAAPVWFTEAYYQKMLGHPVDLIEIPEQENVHAQYIAGLMKDAVHVQAAKDFMDFLIGPEAAAVYKKFGFERP
jgi:ABC-type molybdate transport system substrate-binding protein